MWLSKKGQHPNSNTTKTNKQTQSSIAIKKTKGDFFRFFIIPTSLRQKFDRYKSGKVGRDGGLFLCLCSLRFEIFHFLKSSWFKIKSNSPCTNCFAHGMTYFTCLSADVQYKYALLAKAFIFGKFQRLGMWGLLSMHEALDSIPSPVKTRTKTEQKLPWTYFARFQYMSISEWCRRPETLETSWLVRDSSF